MTTETEGEDMTGVIEMIDVTGTKGDAEKWAMD